MSDTVKTPLKNLATGEIAQFDNIELRQRLLSGDYSLVAGSKVPMLRPDGSKAGFVAAEQAHDLMSQGWSIPDAKQVEHIRNVQEANTNLGMAESFAAGAARALTFGASDWALTKTGLASPDYLKTLKKENPISSLAGEIGGVAGSMLIPGGGVVNAAKLGLTGVKAAKAASTALKVAEEANELKTVARAIVSGKKALTPVGEALSFTPRAIEASGNLAREISGSLAAQMGLELSGRAANVIQNVAKYAVEGGMYSLNPAVSEAALNPDWTAEQMLMNGGLNVLFGAGMGGALPIVGGIGKELLGAIQKGFSAAGEQLDSSVLAGLRKFYGKVASESGRLKNSEAAKLFTEDSAAFRRGLAGVEREPALQALNDEIIRKAKAIGQFHDGIEKTFENLYAGVHKASSAIPPNKALNDQIVSSMEAFLTKSHRLLDDVHTQTYGVANKEVFKLREALDALDRRFTAEFAPLHGGTERSLSAPDTFEGLLSFRRALDDLAKWHAVNITPSNADRAVMNVSGKIRDELVNPILRNENYFGVAATRLKKADEYFAAFKRADEALKPFLSVNPASGLREIDAVKLQKLFSQEERLTGQKFQNAFSAWSEWLAGDNPGSFRQLVQYEQGLGDLTAQKAQALLDHAMFTTAVKNPDIRAIVANALTPGHYQSTIKALYTEGMAFRMPSHSILNSTPATVLAAMGAHAIGIPYSAIIPVVALHQTLKDPYYIAKTLGYAEKHLPAVMKQFSVVADTVIKGQWKKITPLVASEVAREKVADFRERLSHFDDQQAVTDHIHNAFAGAESALPNTAIGVEQRFQAAREILKKALPQPDRYGHLDKEELSRFSRVLNYIDNPASVIEEIQSGNPSQQAIEVLSKVFPHHKQQILQAIADKASTAGSDLQHLPRQSRELLDRVFGTQFAYSGAHINSIQAALHQAKQQQRARGRLQALKLDQLVAMQNQKGEYK